VPPGKDEMIYLGEKSLPLDLIRFEFTVNLYGEGKKLEDRGLSGELIKN